MSEKRFVPYNYTTSIGGLISITDTTLNFNKEISILDSSSGNGVANTNSYTYEKTVNFGKVNYNSTTALTNCAFSVTLTIKLNKADSTSSCNLRFIKLKFVDTFGVTTTAASIGFNLYIKLVDLNNNIIAFSNGITSGLYVGTYALINNRTVTSSTPISAGSWDSTYLIDLSDKTIKPYTNDLLLKALCVKDILSPNVISLTRDFIPPQSDLTDNIARSFLNNTYTYGGVQLIDYPEYLGIHNTCTFNIYDKNYALEDTLIGNVKILTPEDVIPVAGTNSLIFTTYNLYIKQLQPISDVYYFRFILTTINGVPKFKNTGRYKCIININFQFGDVNDVRTFTFRAIIDPNATFTMPTQFLVDIQEEHYLPFKETTISSGMKAEYENLLNYAIAEPFIDKPAADYIVEPIGDWDNEDESNTEGDV